MTVSIVEMTSGVTVVAWLCEVHQTKRRADGWSVKVGALLTFPCDECPKPEAPAALDFVPTGPSARRPTREECPPPPPMAPWAKPQPKKQAKEAA